MPHLIIHLQAHTLHINRKQNISSHRCTDNTQMNRAFEGQWLTQREACLLNELLYTVLAWNILAKAIFSL